MRIYIANSSQQKIGGGWSFIRNFKKGMGDLITENYDEADVYFIASPSMVQRDEVNQAYLAGKKIILRIDNAVRNSRNRNTGMSRMYDFAHMADKVIFQSNWAYSYLKPFLKVQGEVVLNGVDLNLYPETEKQGRNILYSRFNRDETKNYEAARYWYSCYQQTYKDAKLYIVGQFSEELRSGNFDFYNNERYEYLGVLEERQLAKVYGTCSHLLYTYFNDACSNTLIEALVSGCKIVGAHYYKNTGGAKQIISTFQSLGRDYFSLERMCSDYKKIIEEAMMEVE